jgi:hypothetical protein
MTLSDYEEGLVRAYRDAYVAAGGSNVPETLDIVERLRDEAAITVEDARELGTTEAHQEEDEAHDGFY